MSEENNKIPLPGEPEPKPTEPDFLKEKKWFDVDYSQYTLWQDGFNHLSLEKKLEMLKNITGFKEVTVCEDYSEHYDYWKEHFNPNPNDCCNLSIFTPKEDA